VASRVSSVSIDVYCCGWRHPPPDSAMVRCLSGMGYVSIYRWWGTAPRNHEPASSMQSHIQSVGGAAPGTWTNEGRAQPATQVLVPITSSISSLFPRKGHRYCVPKVGITSFFVGFCNLGATNLHFRALAFDLMCFFVPQSSKRFHRILCSRSLLFCQVPHIGFPVGANDFVIIHHPSSSRGVTLHLSLCGALSRMSRSKS